MTRRGLQRGFCCKATNNISFLQDCSNLVIIPVDKKSEDEGLIDAITDNLKDVDKNKTIVKAGNVKDNADATMKAKDGQAVLLVAKYGKTRKSDLLFAKSELEKTAVPILGVIIDQCT